MNAAIVEALAIMYPGVVVEQKASAIAVHYRAAPDAEPALLVARVEVIESNDGTVSVDIDVDCDTGVIAAAGKDGVFVSQDAGATWLDINITTGGGSFSAIAIQKAGAAGVADTKIVNRFNHYQQSAVVHFQSSRHQRELVLFLQHHLN